MITNFICSVFYIIIGKLLDKKSIKRSQEMKMEPLKAGKIMFYTGFVLFGCTFLGFVPALQWKFFGMSLFNVLFDSIETIYFIVIYLYFMGENRKISYGFRMQESVYDEDKETFEKIYKKYPKLLLSKEDPTIFIALAEKGLLEEWVGDKKHLFNEQVKKNYYNYRLKSLYANKKTSL